MCALVKANISSVFSFFFTFSPQRKGSRRVKKAPMFPGGKGSSGHRMYYSGNFLNEVTLKIYIYIVYLEQHLQKLRDLLSSVNVPASSEVEETPSMSAWTKRQLTAERKFRAAMPDLLNCQLAAVVRCLDSVPLGTHFFCPAFDLMVHKKHVFHV